MWRSQSAHRLLLATGVPHDLREIDGAAERRRLDPRMHCVAIMISKESVTASISHELTADHERLDQLFEDACARVGAGDFAVATMTFGQFARDLEHHIAIEERFLFPAFDARVRMPGPTTVMRHEHRAIEQLLAVATESLTSADAPRFAAATAELATILAAHNLKEERVLYPRSDAALDDTERAQVIAALRR